MEIGWQLEHTKEDFVFKDSSSQVILVTGVNIMSWAEAATKSGLCLFSLVYLLSDGLLICLPVYYLISHTRMDVAWGKGLFHLSNSST